MGTINLFIPPFLTLLFMGYILYLALVKKNLKAKMRTVVLPGMFFISVWAVMYFVAFSI